jgi:hypothetical protein
MILIRILVLSAEIIQEFPKWVYPVKIKNVVIIDVVIVDQPHIYVQDVMPIIKEFSQDKIVFAKMDF